MTEAIKYSVSLSKENDVWVYFYAYSLNVYVHKYEIIVMAKGKR